MYNFSTILQTAILFYLLIHLLLTVLGA